jgi:hypothetical protein
LFEHDLFGKPVSTFPDHALAGGTAMQLRVFGRTGMQLSVLGFGCGAVGGFMVRGDPVDQERTIARAIAAGERLKCLSDTWKRVCDGVSF